MFTCDQYSADDHHFVDDDQHFGNCLILDRNLYIDLDLDDHFALDNLYFF